MKSPQQFLATGIAFLFCGVAFFAAALLTKQIAFYGIAPAFLTFGIVFIALSRSKRG